jgi:hypothetical protein
MPLTELSSGLRRISRKYWRKYIADECPDEREMRRRNRIDTIIHDVTLLEAMRLWSIEVEKAGEARARGFAKPAVRPGAGQATQA